MFLPPLAVDCRKKWVRLGGSGWNRVLVRRNKRRIAGAVGRATGWQQHGNAVRWTVDWARDCSCNRRDTIVFRSPPDPWSARKTMRTDGGSWPPGWSWRRRVEHFLRRSSSVGSMVAAVRCDGSGCNRRWTLRGCHRYYRCGADGRERAFQPKRLRQQTQVAPADERYADFDVTAGTTT